MKNWEDSAVDEYLKKLDVGVEEHSRQLKADMEREERVLRAGELLRLKIYVGFLEDESRDLRRDRKVLLTAFLISGMAFAVALAFAVGRG